MHGGAADRSGLIHVGDEVIEVNNINVEGKTPADVLTILVRQSYWLVIWSFQWDFKSIHSKIQTESLRSNLCQLMENLANVKVKFVLRLILTTIRTTTHISHVRKQVSGSTKATSCILFLKWVSQSLKRFKQLTNFLPLHRMTPTGGRQERRLTKQPGLDWFHREPFKREELSTNVAKQLKTWVEASRKVRIFPVISFCLFTKLTKSDPTNHSFIHSFLHQSTIWKILTKLKP